jgi:hypothetical protein
MEKVSISTTPTQAEVADAGRASQYKINLVKIVKPHILCGFFYA